MNEYNIPFFWDPLTFELFFVFGLFTFFLFSSFFFLIILRVVVIFVSHDDDDDDDAFSPRDKKSDKIDLCFCLASADGERKATRRTRATRTITLQGEDDKEEGVFCVFEWEPTKGDAARETLLSRETRTPAAPRNRDG